MRWKIINFLAFQLGWSASVLGAAWGSDLVGPVVVAAIVMAHLAASKRLVREAIVLLTCGAIGVVVDSALVGFAVFHPAGSVVAPLPLPLWLLGLWVLVGTTLNSSLSWLQGRPWLAAALGGPGGAVAYAAGARLGAITIGDSSLLSIVIIGGAWTLVTPLLLHVARNLLRDERTAKGIATSGPTRGRRTTSPPRRDRANGIDKEPA